MQWYVVRRVKWKGGRMIDRVIVDGVYANDVLQAIPQAFQRNPVGKDETLNIECEHQDLAEAARKSKDERDKEDWKFERFMESLIRRMV